MQHKEVDMGKIANKYFEGGQAPTAAELNAVYNSVASDNVNDENLGTEWAQRKHFSESNSITSLFNFDYDGTNDFSVNSTNYTTIQHTDLSRVLPDYTTHGNAVVRVQASGLISEGTLQDRDGDGTSSQINRNTYAFRLLITLTNSIGTSSTTVANCTYSFTEKAALTQTNSSLATGSTAIIQFRNFAFSGLIQLAPGNTIDKIELQACVGFNGNIIKIQHNHIQVIVVEN